MTSSFTTMLLTALALLTPEGAAPVPALAASLRALLPRYAAEAAPARTPERLVFLGAGPLAFAARESALKVMELTAGAGPLPLGLHPGLPPRPQELRAGRDRHLLCSPPTPTPPSTTPTSRPSCAPSSPSSRVTTLGPGGDLDVPLPEGDAWGRASPCPTPRSSRRPSPTAWASAWTTPSRARAP